MTQLEQLVEQFPTFSGPIYLFDDDCRQITWLDVEGNNIEYIVSTTARCGCCSDIEDISSDLSFIDNMSENDFNDLIEELSRK